MSDDSDERAAIAGIRDRLDRAVERLEAAHARDEALAAFVIRRRVLLIEREPVMVPLGRVWRLGVFLLDRAGALSATGSTTRAVEPGRANYQSQSAESRREYRAAAFRGPFIRGETVNYDAVPIVLDAEALRTSTGPLLLRDGRALVRWAPSLGADAAIEFDAYLAERVDLLVHPPEGA